eukprot:5157913-Pleurochrysis_carterae.AAC.1
MEVTYIEVTYIRGNNIHPYIAQAFIAINLPALPAISSQTLHTRLSLTRARLGARHCSSCCW